MGEKNTCNLCDLILRYIFKKQEGEMWLRGGLQL